ncbi:MAG TPA: peptidylprolyl isomerase [Nitrospiria bacterium]|nr:peptidylprolyl isomerase [Nitrospiria bacterium]
MLIVAALAGGPRLGQAADDRVAARVNGVPIMLAHVDRAVDEKVPRITGHGVLSDSRRRVLRAQVLENLIDEELMVQEARRRKLTADASAVDEETAKIRKRFEDSKQYADALSRAGLSESDVRTGVERYLLVKRVTELAVTAKVTVTDASMRAYYDADPSRFVVPEQVRYRQIVIGVDPGGSPAEWDAARQRAAGLAKQARGGKSFADMAKTQSDDAKSRESGGDMGWVHRGRLEHDDDAAIFALPPGGVSDPVRTLYGYAIYRVEEKKKAKALGWDEVNKTRLADELRRAETDRVRAEWLGDLRQRARVEVLPAEP